MKRLEKNVMGALLLVLVVAVVPLIVSAKKYNTGMEDFLWFSNTETTYDFFLYWKGQALILICGILSAYLSVKIMVVGLQTVGSFEMKYVIPIVLYAVTVFASTMVSEYRTMALWGGYEQWEGMVIMEVYVVLLCMSYALMKGKTEIHIMAYGLFVGVVVISVLSVMQAMGLDFFRTSVGQNVLNFMSARKLQFTFNFEPGRVYATLYNPNYVGSYVAITLPIILSCVAFQKKFTTILRSMTALVVAVFLVVMLLGSQSVTGFIGVIAVICLCGIFFLGNRQRRTWKVVAGGVMCLMALVVVVLSNPSIFEYGWNKIVNPTPNRAIVTAMESREGYLWITTKDSVLKLAIQVNDGVYQYEAMDGDGNTANIVRDEENAKMHFEDERFSKIELQETFVNAEGEQLPAVVIGTPSVGRSYIVVPRQKEYGDGLIQTTYQMYNPFEKLDDISHIPRIGFEDNQHFGSRRGYIWSRTFPLLTKHLLLGSGPNTFACEFPNNDYVGMKNVGYDGAIVTKPHNMYLQMWVQTGFISLVAFIFLYGIYFADCVRTYWRKQKFDFTMRFGVGIWFGTFGYLVTGLANDSSVCVAPLYWCLLGVGMAVNRYVSREEKKGSIK